MDVLTHALSQCPINELMLTHFGLPTGSGADDERFEMTTIACHFDVIALQAAFDALFDELRVHGESANDGVCSLSG